jgi:hypothetical protein
MNTAEIDDIYNMDNNIFMNMSDHDLCNIYNFNDKTDIENMVFPSTPAKPINSPEDGKKKNKPAQTNNEKKRSNGINENKPKINVLTPAESRNIFEEEVKNCRVETFMKEYKKAGYKKKQPDDVLYNDKTQKFEKKKDIQEMEKEIREMERDPNLDKRNFYAKSVDKEVCDRIRNNPEKSKEILNKTNTIRHNNVKSVLVDYNKELVNELVQDEKRRKDPNVAERGKEKAKLKEKEKEVTYNKKNEDYSSTSKIFKEQKKKDNEKSSYDPSKSPLQNRLNQINNKSDFQHPLTIIASNTPTKEKSILEQLVQSKTIQQKECDKKQKGVSAQPSNKNIVDLTDDESSYNPLRDQSEQTSRMNLFREEMKDVVLNFKGKYFI